MAELVGGAVIGAVFGELLKAVLEMKDKATMFKQTLISLRSTLVAIAPVIKEIEQQNIELGRPIEELKPLIKEMEDGTKLVYRCSRIHRLNYLAKARYQEQLEALVDSLVMFFLINMQAQTTRDQKETLLKVRRIFSAVNKFQPGNREDTVAVVASASSSESGINDSSATQPDENALETNSVINQATGISSSGFDAVTVTVDVSESESTTVAMAMAMATATQSAGTNSVEQVTAALSRAGLVSSKLIIGIDFTKSNEWTGRKSFNRRSLHHIGNDLNPYEQAISIIGKTLSSFNEDNLIPCFGFGDASTQDEDVFSFHSDERFCNGFEEVLSRYRDIVPSLRLSGPTSFAPIIERAITIVEKSGKYHVLLIIADGQVTRNVRTPHGQLGPQEQKTIDAIVKASKYPLSIVLVGVGDGPWDMMREFDDNIPARAFGNFKFVNFTEILSKRIDLTRKETEFALAALKDIPSQYKATMDLGILGDTQMEHSTDRVPPSDLASSSNMTSFTSNCFQQRTSIHTSYDNGINTESGLYGDKVTATLSRAGLVSSNLIIAIDFTKSNEWTGRKSFNRRSLHHIGNGLNPYEQAISIIGKTLSSFNEDNLIPCFGFGDASTRDEDVFSFHSDERFCNGFEEVLTRYREIVPCLRLSGPTSFAPIIERAITIVKRSGKFHVLLIIADGQVTRAVDTPHGQLSQHEQKTIDAIVKASAYPLSIVLVGVGDGPWDMMMEFDDNIPTRTFDNFKFVNFTEILSKRVDLTRKETEFALAALMDIPSQYKATIDLGILGDAHMGHSTYRVPPSHYDTASSTNVPSFPSNSFQQRTSIHTDYDNGINTEPSSSGLYVNKVSAALSSAGLVYSNLIIGIDFTKSNEWTGKKSFNRRSLHHIGSGHNPYEQAISIIGKTLSSLNADNSIPCFGFGDASTHDEDVFSFLSNERFCDGFEEALSRYREIVPCLRLSGPTSFAPIIEMAMTIVERSGGKFYVLIIIADGQVTRAVDTPHGQLSPQERKTIDAIVKASEYPMSIVLVGVGDGPWDMMMKLDDKIPARAFDNFQFVNFTKIMSKSEDSTRKDTEFAQAALMKIPSQYKATVDHGILGAQRGHSPGRVPLPPPC